VQYCPSNHNTLNEKNSNMSTHNTQIIATMVIVSSGVDSTFAPPSFLGTDVDDAEGWMTRFEKYAIYRGLSEQERLHLLALLLRDEASHWCNSLQQAVKDDWQALSTAFKEQLQDSDLLCWQKATVLWNRAQGTEELVDAYVTTMKEVEVDVLSCDVAWKILSTRNTFYGTRYLSHCCSILH